MAKSKLAQIGEQIMQAAQPGQLLEGKTLTAIGAAIIMIDQRLAALEKAGATNADESPRKR